MSSISNTEQMRQHNPIPQPQGHTLEHVQRWQPETPRNDKKPAAVASLYELVKELLSRDTHAGDRAHGEQPRGFRAPLVAAPSVRCRTCPPYSESYY
mmetsp:Transcript_6927/g.7528  ORF Transcript_6927/g.7528 Transcript_6927/m.7528 type:complete len:97 (-) Transcript_6927:22-312(-)